MVIPDILRRNKTRVLRAIPAPPPLDIKAILDSLWVLECEEHSKQGSAFWLAEVGLVTCDHVLGPGARAFRPSEPTRYFDVRVVARHAAIDLAILTLENLPPRGLQKGSADALRPMDHIAVAGFPNYRVGDTGVVYPGLVVGFRPISGIRRILTNAAIVRGMSGGAVVSRENLVVGVAVTGADRMEEVQRTEDHGVIPIEALRFLASGT